MLWIGRSQTADSSIELEPLSCGTGYRDGAIEGVEVANGALLGEIKGSVL